MKARDFDVAYVIDKSAKAVGIAASLQCKQVLGFAQNALNGAILPATAHAEELWGLGLDNQKKFFINSKSEVQLVAEALNLTTADNYSTSRFKYNLPLSEIEEKLKEELVRTWRKSLEQPIIGINTGCSDVIAAKKLSVEYQRNLIKKLQQTGYKNIVLLGGPEDTLRNSQIAEGLDVVNSPTQQGLRNGLVSVAACDLVITGDSLGMHMAISQEKFVIAWFGPTCAQEIELYDNGVKILSKATCSPCWKRSCGMTTMCYDQVDINSFMTAVEVGAKRWQQQNPALISLEQI